MTGPWITPPINVLVDLMAEQACRIKRLEGLLRETRIAAGLEYADPHELDDVGMQKSHVREQYDAFDFHNS